MELVRGKLVRVARFKGDLGVDMRCLDSDGLFTRKGIRLSLPRFRVLMEHHLHDITELALLALSQPVLETRWHLGGNIYASVQSKPPIFDIRQFWKPDDEDQARPTKRGFATHLANFPRLREILEKCREFAAEEYNAAIPCRERAEHVEQGQIFSCEECNPDGYKQWLQSKVEPDAVGSQWQLPQSFFTQSEY